MRSEKKTCFKFAPDYNILVDDNYLYYILKQRINKMPIISRFYGIIIKMYFKEHGIPHFHAVYGVFNIETIEMIEGDLPNRAKKLINEWSNKYKNDLLEMWSKKKFKQLPGLE